MQATLCDSSKCSFAVGVGPGGCSDGSSPGVLSRTGGSQCESPSCGYLSLSGMGISTIAKGTFAGMVHLTVLDLGSNSISSISHADLKDLAGLKTLILKGNALTLLQNGTFEGLSSLEMLSLESNSLSSLEPGTFQGLSSLKELSLKSNSLSSLEPGTFQGLSQLRTLDLRRNLLRSLRSVGPFSGMPELRTLSMAYQRQGPTSWHIGSGTFSGNLSQLTYLDLSGECCYSLSSSYSSVIEPGALDGLTGLQELSLQSIGLTDAGLPAGLFLQCKSLTRLNMYYNRLSSITNKTFAGLENSLLYLTLSSNQITKISGKAFYGFQQLYELRLDSNMISFLSAEVFTNMKIASLGQSCQCQGNLYQYVSLYGNPLVCKPDSPSNGYLSLDSGSSLPRCPSEVRSSCGQPRL